MPIHDLGYRHWSGDWTSHPYRWWVITRQGILQLARKKSFLVLMFLSMIPFLVRSIMLYVTVVMGRFSFARLEPKFFEDFLSQQMFFTFIITIYAGAGLIANDLKANALQIYFSKAITRRDYMIGKLGVPVFFISLVTLVPALLLFLLAAVFHTSLAFLIQNYWVVASIAGYSAIIIFTNALVILALSALGRSSRFAGINFAAVIFFSQILYGILFAMLRSTRIAWISLWNNLRQVGDFLFQNAATYRYPTWISLLVLLALMGFCAWIVHRRVQAVEVIR